MRAFVVMEEMAGDETLYIPAIWSNFMQEMAHKGSIEGIVLVISNASCCA